MSDAPTSRPSRAPLLLAIGCLVAALLGGCGLLGLLFLGALVAGAEGEAGPAGAGQDAAPVSDADATLRWDLPSGWKEEANGWLARRTPDPLRPGAELAAQARFLPAVPAQGDPGEALRQAWRSGVPPELADRASGMVYRRYVGDGLVANFLVGGGREQGRRADTLCTLYLIDCGPSWRPLLIAQTYENPAETIPSLVEMAAGFSYTASATLAEELLAALRCPAGKGRPLVDPEALVGHYWYGSGSALQWENVNTGATTMTTVSYGGELDLRADGTYESKFSSASGEVGRLQFGSEDQRGQWRVEGDQLVLTVERGQDRRRRIAGLTTFSDGVKVALLLLRLDLPVNATTVNEPGCLYSTKKKE